MKVESEELPEGKGWFKVVISLAEHRKTFTELKEDTELSNGTTQRRLEQLQDMGWVHTVAEMRDDNAVKMYFIGGKAYSVMQIAVDPLLDEEQRRPEE